MKRHSVVLAIAALSFATACASSNEKSTSQTSSQAQTQAALEADPMYSLTLMRQGSVLLQQGRYQDALTAFEDADRIAPGNATVKNMMGLCHLRMGQFDQALASFDLALRTVPGFTDARNNRGAAYLALGQYHLAEVDFVAVLGDSTYPHRRQVYYNLGISNLQRDQLGAAEENFRRSIVQPSPVFDGYIQLSQLAQRRGELDVSLVLLEEAKVYFPEEPSIPLELGKLLILLDREDEALPYLEQVIADAPGSQAAATARTLLGQN